jgi:hypothetical protein
VASSNSLEATMRSIPLALALTLAVPSAAAAGLDDSSEQLRWPPILRPQPPPRYPLPPRRSRPPVQPDITEADWARTLVRARDRASSCTRTAVLSGAIAVAGLVSVSKHPATPGPEDREAGLTGKRDTVLNALGATSAFAGGIVFLSSGRCASYHRAIVDELEREGRRRGFGPPALPPLSRDEWQSRLDDHERRTSIGRWLTMSGTAAVLAAGSAIRDYDPRPDQRGVSRLGPGGPVLIAGFGASVIGAVLWAEESAEVRRLRNRPPGPVVAIELGRSGRGFGARFVVGF